MARKKNRNRSKAKESSEVETVTLFVDTDSRNENVRDSGNESPPSDITPVHCREHTLSYHCPDSIKAWEFYQACILERYHWFLDKKRRVVADDFSTRISQACLHLPADVLSVKTSELQRLMAEELKDIDMEEELANFTFRENIRQLKAGKAMADLPSVDPHVTLDQVSQFISKYEKTDEEVHCNGTKEMSLSFSGSVCSEDSGLLLLDKTSPRSLGLPSLSEIWKPENDKLFENSFSANGFYGSQPNISYSDAGTHPYLADVHNQIASHQPSIADDDSAIQAVVYTQGPCAKDSSSSCLGLSSLANLSSEYGTTDSQFYQVANMANTDLAFFGEPTNPLSLASAATDAVDDKLINYEIKPVSKPSAQDSLLGETSCTLEKSKPDATKTTSKKKNKKKSKASASANGAPVKFTDCKTVDNKDMKLVKGLTFGWLKGDEDESENAEERREEDDKAEEIIESQPINTNRKLLSFAAVVSSSPAYVKPASVKEDILKNTYPKAMYSTRKNTRKFSKSSSLNKTSICWTFLKLKKCPWGKECIFAHGKKELRPIPDWFKEGGKQLVIGKLRKIEDAPHSEPCGNHYCHWRRQFLLRKTAMCKLWESGRCADCREKCQFAHGHSDLKPLPKTELCRMHFNGKCPLATTECVYAHSKSELVGCDTKKGKKVNLKTAALPDSAALSITPSRRLRTISETSTTSNDSWSSLLRPERVRTVSGTSLQSNEGQAMRDLEEFDWLAWDSQYEVPSDEEFDYEWNHDECIICAFDFTEENPKFALMCEHETFHRQCISQWIVMDATCPICREPVNIDEKFKLQIENDEDWSTLALVE